MSDAMGNVTLRDLSEASGFTVRQLRYLESRYRLLTARTRPRRPNRDQLEYWRRYFRRQDEESAPYYAWNAFMGERTYAVHWNRREMIRMMRDVVLGYRRHFRGVTKYYLPRTIHWIKKLWAKSQEGLSPAELKEWSKTRFDRTIVLSVPPVPPTNKSKPSQVPTKTTRLVA